MDRQLETLIVQRFNTPHIANSSSMYIALTSHMDVVSRGLCGQNYKGISWSTVTYAKDVSNRRVTPKALRGFLFGKK